MIRFVNPEVVRLPLRDAQWLDVKRELTIKEQREIFAHMIRDGQYEYGTAPQIDPEQVGRARVLGYVVDWSAEVPFSADALDRVSVDTFAEILAAVDAHIAVVEVPDEKKAPAGAPA
jgi:hypothetical protein